MKILIYINKNRDIRIRRERVAREIRDNLGEDLIEISEVNQKDRSLEKIKESDSIIIFAHGGEDKIFHNCGEDEEILIDNSNLSILNGKKVIAFSCFTARKLGESAITQGCTCYIGFFDSINRYLLDAARTPDQIKEFLNAINNNAFKKILIESISKNNKMIEISKSLKHELRASALKNIQGYHNEKFKEYIPQILYTVGNTAEGIRCLGNGEVQLR